MNETESEEKTVMYEAQLSHAHVHVLIDALELLTRLGIGQLEHVLEKLDFLYSFDRMTYEAREEARELVRLLKKVNFEFDVNQSYSIASAEVPDHVKVAYDLLKTLQKRVAVTEQHDRTSVWHDGPMLHLGSEPLATVVVKTDEENVT